jgi:predicted DNA-binding ribbon-helix-helix protein
VSRPAKNGESRVLKRSVRIGEHKTSFTVEEEFWRGLKEISLVKQLPLANLLADIDRDREHANLSSAVRLYVLDHYRRIVEEAALGGKVKR